MPKKPPGRKPSLSDADRETVQAMASEGATIDEITQSLGIPRSTVGDIVQKVYAAEAETAELASVAVRAERTPRRLRELLEDVPGLGPGKIAFAEKLAKSNKLLLSDPGQLYVALVHGIGLTPYLAHTTVTGLFADYFTQNPAATSTYIPNGLPNPFVQTGMQNPVTAPHPQDPTQQLLSMVALLKGLRSLEPPPQDPGPDPAIVATLNQLQAQNAAIMSQLEAEKARRETAETYSRLLWERERSETQLKVELAKTQAGLAGGDLVATKAIEGATAATTRLQQNLDSRMDRAERLIAPLLRGMQGQPSVVLPPSASDLESIAGQPVPTGQAPSTQSGYPAPPAP